MMRPRFQSGFAYVAAVVLLVILAAMAIAVVRLTTTQNATQIQDVQGIRASLAARGGVEWGLYMVRTGKCTAGTSLNQTLRDMRPASGFIVTVSCTGTAFNEGETDLGAALEKVLYRIEAVACNDTDSCPGDESDAADANYVERKRVATACQTKGGEHCY